MSENIAVLHIMNSGGRNKNYEERSFKCLKSIRYSDFVQKRIIEAIYINVFYIKCDVNLIKPLHENFDENFLPG